MKKVVIVGGGGHAKVVMDTIEKMASVGEDIEIVGFLDDNEENSEIYGYSRLGRISEVDRYKKNLFHLAIGNNDFRKRFYEENNDLEYLTVIHSRSIISKRSKIGDGCFIGAGAVVNVDSQIGKLSIINTKSIIEHDCVLGDYVHVSYGCIVGSGSTLEECAFVDMGSIVPRNTRIEK